VTLLQLPDSLFIEEISKVSPSTLKLNKEQLSQTLTKLRKKTTLGHKQANKGGLIPDARQISSTEDEFLQTNKFICEQLMKDKAEFSYLDFKEVRQELQIALRHYEFYQYDHDEKEEKISAADFAKSLLTCLPMNQAQQYLKRILTLTELEDKKVSFKEFIAFTFFLDDVEQVKEKVMAFRFITKTQLMELAEDFCKTNPYCIKNRVKVSWVQIDALVQLLDLDGNGQLEMNEVVGVLEKRHMFGMGKEAELKAAIGTSFSKVASYVKESLKF